MEIKNEVLHVYNSKYGDFNILFSRLDNLKKNKISIDEVFTLFDKNSDEILCFDTNLLQYNKNIYTFSLKAARISTEYIFKDYSEIKAYILNWPLSTLRLITNFDNKMKIKELVIKIIKIWSEYSDYINDINSKYNKFLIVLRKENSDIVLDLIFKNDLINEKNSFYADEYMAIKNEELSFIEFLGDALLPFSLKEDIDELEQLLTSVRNVDEVIEMIEENTDLKKYIPWIKANINNNMIKEEYFLDEVLKEKIGKTFEKMLEDCAVFQNNEIGRRGFLDFLNKI